MRALVLSLVPLLTGCVTPRAMWMTAKPGAGPEFNSITPVMLLAQGADESGTILGTGFYITPNRIITCQHIVGRDQAVYLGEAEPLELEVELRSGYRGGPWNDWATLRTPVDASIPYRLSPWVKLRPGDPVIVVGYPGPGETLEEVRARRMQVIDCEVLDARRFFPGAPEGAFVVAKTSHRGSLAGCSGGPAAVWDPLTGEWIVFGLLTTHFSSPDPRLGPAPGTYMLIRRIPDGLLAEGP